jgi:hypothetical protein
MHLHVLPLQQLQQTEIQFLLLQMLEFVLGKFLTVLHLFEFLLLAQAAAVAAEETLNLDKVVALAAAAVVPVN